MNKKQLTGNAKNRRPDHGRLRQGNRRRRDPRQDSRRQVVPLSFDR